MTLTRTTTLLATVIAAAALAACGHSSTSDDRAATSGSFNIQDEQVVITAKGVPEARVTADGRLTIDGQDVSLTEGQRAQLISYYNAATGVVGHAAETGAAGARVGAAAVSGVAAGLGKGDMSDLKANVEAQAATVRREALKICDNLADMRAAQDALAAQVEAFKPYAVVSARETTECANGLRQRPAS